MSAFEANENFGLNFENIITSMQDDDKQSIIDKKTENNNNKDKTANLNKPLLDINIEDIEKNIIDNKTNKTSSKTLPSKEKNIDFHTGHRQRARERFLLNPDNISDRDLLELMLFWIIPRADVKPIVQTLLDKFKTINGIYNANVEEINNCGANGQAIKYIFQMVHTINNRILTHQINKLSLDNVNTLVNYCRSLFHNWQEEELFIILLDNKLKLIQTKSLGYHKTHNVIFSFRDIIKDILTLNANNIVLTHNHPSNSTQPSTEDIQTTEQLKQMLTNIDVNIIDHIIIGTNNYFSFAENDMI